MFEGTVQEHLASGRYQGFVRDRSPEELWRSLVREYRWVYLQMNGQLRQDFLPFFLYTELRTLGICLRRLRDKNPAAAGELLELSLLSDDLKRTLSESQDLAGSVKALERRLCPLSSRFSGLSKNLEASGLRAVEQQLVTAFLDLIMTARLEPLIRTFFIRLIDARNILNMYKYLRLEETHYPPFFSGGMLDQAKLRKAVAKDNFFAIGSLVRERFGVRIDTSEPTRVEMALARAMTGFLKKEGREPFGAGPILDYLWRCSTEVMNLSVLMNTKGLERDLAEAELVK